MVMKWLIGDMMVTLMSVESRRENLVLTEKAYYMKEK